MDDGKFRIIFNVLKTMEHEEIVKGSVENVIIKIIDNSEKMMTEDQKKKIYGEFVHYEQKRKERRESDESRKHLEEEKYKDFIEEFFAHKDFSGW